VLPEDNQPHTAAGRRWLRAYINGCAFKVFDAVLPLHLVGVPFCNVVEWLYRTSGFVLIGALHSCTLLKPCRLDAQTALLMIASQ
jgi:hypothetical protein